MLYVQVLQSVVAKITVGSNHLCNSNYLTVGYVPGGQMIVFSGV